MLIYGKNAIMEALKSEKTFNRLFIDKDNKSMQDIIDLARESGIKIDFCSKIVLDNKVASLKSNQRIAHQGIVADIVDFEYAEIEDIFKLASERNEDPFILILDGVEDPHNLGAIIRTAECAGVHGVIIPENRACAVNDTVLKTSAGAVSNVNVIRVVNLNRTIEQLKEKGVWIYACEIGGENLFKANLKGSVAIVVGSEGKGMSRLVKENCDSVLTIPMKGKINSLNVSVAAAISIFEVVRNR